MSQKYAGKTRVSGGKPQSKMLKNATTVQSHRKQNQIATCQKRMQEKPGLAKLQSTALQNGKKKTNYDSNTTSKKNVGKSPVSGGKTETCESRVNK